MDPSLNLWIIWIVHLHSLASGQSSSDRLQDPVYWGKWSEWSSCSSTCGQGVSTRTRSCLSWSLSGQGSEVNSWRCAGRAQARRVCTNTDCGPRSRREDDIVCRRLGKYVPQSDRQSWHRVLHKDKPCKIICQRYQPPLLKHVGNVRDKTPCRPSTHGFTGGYCEKGVCKKPSRKASYMKPGVPKPYRRQLEEEKTCLFFERNNATCDRVQGLREPAKNIHNTSHRDDGYITQIPRGSTFIIINKFSISKNHLVVVNSRNINILSSAERPQGRTTIQGAGVVWTYEKSTFSESLSTSGPIQEDVAVLVFGDKRNHRTFFSFWSPRSISSAQSWRRASSRHGNDNDNIDEALVSSSLDSQANLSNQGRSRENRHDATKTRNSGRIDNRISISRLNRGHQRSHGNSGTTTSLERIRPTTHTTPSSKSRQQHSDADGSDRRRRQKRKRARKKKTMRNSQNEVDDRVQLGEAYKCYPCPRAKNKRKQFCASDFVSKVYINRRKIVGSETRYDVTVLSSYRNQVGLLAREYLWVESRCRCPFLRAKRTYILMGSMQRHKRRQARLILAPGAFVRGFSLGQDRRMQLLAQKMKSKC